MGLDIFAPGAYSDPMAPIPSSPKFGIWLKQAIAESGLSKREIARRMAAKHPKGATPETVDTARRTLNKIVGGEQTPTQPTRDSIAAALGRGDAPLVDDDEEIDLAATLQAIAREQAEVNRKLSRALKGVRAA